MERRHPGSQDTDTFSLSAVLGLLALLIGFTFSLALQRYDARRELVIAEANALGTTWLRSDLLEPAPRQQLRQVLRRYVANRVAFGAAPTPMPMPNGGSTARPSSCRPSCGPRWWR